MALSKEQSSEYSIPQTVSVKNLGSEKEPENNFSIPQDGSEEGGYSNEDFDEVDAFSPKK